MKTLKIILSAIILLACQSESFSGTIISINAAQEETKIIINWSTASEFNVDFFTVEKSVDGITYKAVGIIDAMENSALTNEYQCIDKQPYAGVNYYRLKETSNDGLNVYSAVIAVDFTQKEFNNAYPNPLYNTDLSLALAFPKTQVTIFSRRGKVVFSQLYELAGNVLIDIAQLNEKGIYLIVFTSAEARETRKIIIE